MCFWDIQLRLRFYGDPYSPVRQVPEKKILTSYSDLCVNSWVVEGVRRPAVNSPL
jgi:hypothetical protein